MASYHRILPRIIRLRDAPMYLGMDIHRFNREVRPHVASFAIGKQGVAFDRLDLDAWFEHYKSCHARPVTYRGNKLWEKNDCQVCKNVGDCGTLTKSSQVNAFAKALAQASSKKLKGT